MKHVNNRRVIRRIADQTRKAGKSRNLIAVLAIVLTSLLFTTVFTIGGSLLEKSQEETMRQVGTSAHGEYKYLTQAEYDIVKKDTKLRNISYRITVGDLVNDTVNKLPTEVNYFEDQDARWSFCYPQVGHMPEKEEEFVTSDLVLKALGVPCRLGEQVSLDIQIGEEVISQTFTLSGYYQGDLVTMAQMLMVSKAYQEKMAPVPAESLLDGTPLSPDMYTGRIMADFNFATSLFLERQIDALSRRCGFGETRNVGVNWAYLGQDLDLDSIIFMIVLLFVILLSGYLIIYNIFYINVIRDISHYGLLKTIGTTGKQLRRIVRRQALMLSLWGIPIGLLGGVLIGNLLLPVIMNSMVYADTVNQHVVWKGWIFAGAAVFSFVTVYISCIKPCRVVSRISAIEAVRYTEGQDSQNQGRRRRRMAKRRKKTKRVSPFALAMQNIGRNRKRVFIVVTSLSFALVVLNCIYSIVLGVDIDQFVSALAVTDFSVADATLDNFTSYTNNTAGITQEFLDEAEQQPGITELGNIYLKELFPSFTDSDWKKIEERILDNPETKTIIEQYAPPDESEYMDMIREERWIDGNTYGISHLVMDSLEQVQGTLNWDKFQTGKYVITTRFGEVEEGGSVNYFLPGETITIYNEQGQSRQYEVMAVANIPYACGLKVFGTFNCNYILPEGEFLEFMGEQRPMRTLFNVDSDQEAQIQQWLEAYCQNVNPDLKMTSKAMVRQEYETYRNMIMIVGNLLCMTLGCIGILNFINTMVTSVLARKQEFAMMEAVGMTGKQLRQMLFVEGGYYAVLTAIVSLVLSSLFSLALLRSVELIFFINLRYFRFYCVCRFYFSLSC